MSNVFLCVAKGVINVNKFEGRLLPSSHLKKRKKYGVLSENANNKMRVDSLVLKLLIHIFINKFVIEHYPTVS